MPLYKQYDQAALDEQFNNRMHVPDFSDYFARWSLLSEQARKSLQVVENIRYGSLPRETLDIFPSLQPRSKTLIFIHGGYWQMLDKDMFSFIANSFHSYGITVVLINYPLAPEFSFDQIVSSCRLATTWVYKNISKYNGNTEQIYVSGHSAGGHLTAMLLATDWKLVNADVRATLIKGACVISGLFNLYPISLSYLNAVLKIDPETAVRNSPSNLELFNKCPVIVVVGGEETSEFNDQSEEFYGACKDKGLEVTLLKLPQLNHYSIIENISDPHSEHHQALKKLMQIE